MRCFVALVPPRALTDPVFAWAESALAPLRCVRLIDAASMHLTLAFLGDLDTDGGEVERVGEIVAGLAPRPVRIRLEPRPFAVPKRRPRVLALSEAAGDVGALRAELVSALIAERLLGRDERPFWPHLSVGRVKRGALEGRRGREALAAVAPLSGKAAEPHDGERVVLFRSDLGSERATYTPLAEAPLLAGGRR